MKLHELSNDQISDATRLLKRFVELDLRGAPPLSLAHSVPVNDIYKIGGKIVRLPITVISYQTGQKYIVPLNDGTFLIPAPISNNWKIYKVTSEALSQIISELEGHTFNDFFELVSDRGLFQRLYK